MSRLFFISFNLYDHPYEVYPLGMAVVAESMRKKDHQIILYDFLINGGDEEHLAESVKKYAPDYICISIRNLDDTLDSGCLINNQEKYTQLGKRIQQLRAVSSAVFVLGGAAVSLSPHALLELTGADYAIVGEGEEVLGKLISDLESNKVVDSEVYRAKIPMPESSIRGGFYCPEIVRWYYEHSGLLSIQTKRGCPFKCRYCTYPSLEGNYFRYRDIDDVIEEIQRLQLEYGCQNFFFADSVFNDPAGRYKEFVEAMIREDLNIRWSAYFTPYRLEQADIELCKMSGLSAIELGTDASSSTTLTGLNKMFDWDDVARVNEMIARENLACAHFIIFGGPDETYETLEEGLDNCMKLEKCIIFGYIGIRLYRDTPLYDRAVSEGIISADSDLFEPAYYFSPAIEKEQANEMIAHRWSRKRHLIFPPKKGEEMSQSLKRMFDIKGPTWEHLYHYLIEDPEKCKSECFTEDEYAGKRAGRNSGV